MDTGTSVADHGRRRITTWHDIVVATGPTPGRASRLAKLMATAVICGGPMAKQAARRLIVLATNGMLDGEALRAGVRDIDPAPTAILAGVLGVDPRSPDGWDEIAHDMNTTTMAVIEAAMRGEPPSGANAVLTP